HREAPRHQDEQHRSEQLRLQRGGLNGAPDHPATLTTSSSDVSPAAARASPCWIKEGIPPATAMRSISLVGRRWCTASRSALSTTSSSPIGIRPEKPVCSQYSQPAGS